MTRQQLKAEARPHERKARGARVLILESDRHLKALIVEWLQMAGHDSLHAHDALSAAQLAGGSDVVLVDVRAPCRSAREAVAEVGRALPRTPIIAMSADVLAGGRAGSEALAREIGAAAILVKPFNQEALLEAIERVRS